MTNETQDYRIRMSKEGHEALEGLAKKQRRPMSAVVREALETYLKENGYNVSLEIAWGGKRDKEE